MMKNIVFETSLGPVEGWRDGNVVRATGIPYAKASRYHPPEEVAISPLPFPAGKKSPACPQNPSRKTRALLGRDILEGITLTEDCQYLSLTLPGTPPPPSGWPVMVWVYGGSYTSGAGDSPVYDPYPLVEENGVIVVSINYRLGIMGFLGGYHNIPANLGLLDIMAALKWIQKHIPAFGGDSGNVTLFGQSAGGDAIAHLMLAEDAGELFHKVIIQSAPLGIRKNRAAMIRKMISHAITTAGSADIEDLLKLQSDLILSMKRFGIKGGMPFGVQYGHYPLPPEKDAEKIWRQRSGQWKVLIGWTGRETSVFVPFDKKLRAVGRIPGLGKPVLEWLIRKTTDRIYRNPGKVFASDIACGGGVVYRYSIHWGDRNSSIREAHISDISLLFGRKGLWESSAFSQGKSPEELEQAGREIRQIWCRFARTGALDEYRKIPGIIEYRRVYVS